MRPLYGIGIALSGLTIASLGFDGAAERPGGEERLLDARGSRPAVLGLPVLDPGELRDAAPTFGGSSQYAPVGYEFYFTRAAYSSRGRGWGRGRGQSWATDFPDAEYFFTSLLSRLIDIDVYEDPNPMQLDDPDIRRFPFLYFVEPGQMSMTQSEIEGLRSYLEAGGFIMLDDYWGTYETRVVEDQLRRVLPDRAIEDIPLDHPLFHSVYDIEEIRQVPNVRNGRAVGAGRPGARTDEGDNSQIPSVRGIFDDEGRLMVIIHQNTDLGDAWEHGEDPYYPLEYSTYATEVGINTVVYAMSH